MAERIIKSVPCRGGNFQRLLPESIPVTIHATENKIQIACPFLRVVKPLTVPHEYPRCLAGLGDTDIKAIALEFNTLNQGATYSQAEASLKNILSHTSPCIQSNPQ